LQDNQLTVDIFAISPAEKEANVPVRSEIGRPELSTTFAVGEESDISLPKGPSGEIRPVTAPIDRTDAAVRRGDNARVDVVVRTRKVGHFFPGGTVDAFDVWLELQATDEKGQTIFWSGKVEDDGKGPGDLGTAATPDYDDRKWAFNRDTSTVSGNLKAIPDLPIITIAEDTKTLRVLARNAAAPQPKTVATKEDWTRWNDYGIGLFLQGDLKAAAAAFEEITRADPQNPDGWTNIGRVLVQEG